MNSSAHHVGLTARDLDSAFEFCCDALDLSIISRFEVGSEKFATTVSVNDAPARFTYLDSSGVRVELVEYDPVGTDTDKPTLDRPGATRPGPSVEDVSAAVVQPLTGAGTLSEPQTTETGT